MLLSEYLTFRSILVSSSSKVKESKKDTGLLDPQDGRAAILRMGKHDVIRKKLLLQSKRKTRSFAW